MPGQSANGLGSVTAWTSTFYGRLYDPVVTKTISNNTLTVKVNETFRTENAAGQASSPVNYQPTYRVLYKKTVSSGGTNSISGFRIQFYTDSWPATRIAIDANSVNYLLDCGFTGAVLSGTPSTSYTFTRNTAINQSWTGDPTVNCTFNLVGGKPDLSDFKINITGNGYPSKRGTISAASVNALLNAGYHGLIGVERMQNTGLSLGVNYFVKDTAITNYVTSNNMIYDFVIW